MLQSLDQQLTHSWVRQEFRLFCLDFASTKGNQKLSAQLRRHFVFWKFVDEQCPTRNALGFDVFIHANFKAGIYSHRTSISFLIKRELLPQLHVKEWAQLIQRSAAERLLENIKDRPFASVVKAYYEHWRKRSRLYEKRGWTGDNLRPSPRTITSGLYAAVALLEGLKIQDIGHLRTITQAHVDSFLFKQPGYRVALRSFVRYLNEEVRLFQKIKLPSRGFGIPKNGLLNEERMRSLIDLWLKEEGTNLKYALMCIFLLMYAQTPKKVVAIRLSDIERSGDRAFIWFASERTELPREVADLLHRHLATRKSIEVGRTNATNPYLFPGRIEGNHMVSAALDLYFKQHKLHARTLYSTSMIYLFSHGVTVPKAAVKLLGVSLSSAVRYWRLVHPDFADELQASIRAA